MGKRIRAQRKGSSPRYRVASHRFPGENRMPRGTMLSVKSPNLSTALSTRLHLLE